MKYTEEHEWLRPEGDLVVVGITEYAAEQLGDVVFVELPDAGTVVAKDDEVVHEQGSGGCIQEASFAVRRRLTPASSARSFDREDVTRHDGKGCDLWKFVGFSRGALNDLSARFAPPSTLATVGECFPVLG